MVNKPIFLKGKRYNDKRGFFQEIYLLKKYKIKVIFSAIAYSKKNVIRGLHFQKPDKQTKIIHVIKGKIQDVVVNLKKDSKNFGKVFKYNLVEGDTLIIPNYFAHGYECITKNSIILYHLDNYRNIKAENGIKFNDPELNIQWQTKRPIVSKRDKNCSSFKDFRTKIKSI
jgi:dTDP-4-dehydrorhamnose 3,5-epimerase